MTVEEAKQDMAKQIANAKAAFEERAKGTHTALYKAVVKCALLVERSCKQGMRDSPTNAGVAYGKHNHHPSLPGGYPAPDTGTLMRSITHTIVEDDAEIIGYVGSTITNPPYGAYLEDGTRSEYGTSKMAPRPWLQPSIDANVDNIKKILGDGAQGREVNINAEE